LGKIGREGWGWDWRQCGFGSGVGGIGRLAIVDGLVAANKLSYSVAVAISRRSSALETAAKVVRNQLMVVALWYVVGSFMLESEMW